MSNFFALQTTGSPSLFSVSVAVTLLHLLMLGWMVQRGVLAPPFVKQQKTPLKVQTLTLQPKAPSAPKKTVAVAPPKPQVKKQQQEKKSVPKTPTKRERLLLSASQAMKKIEDSPSTQIKQQRQTPIKRIGSLSIDAPDSSDYYTLLAGALKRQLLLPEYGAVQLLLTVTSSGSVTKVVVVSAESISNKKYIESHLKEAMLAPFGSSFGMAKEKIFTLTLTNE